jgi:hypothetical protein
VDEMPAGPTPTAAHQQPLSADEKQAWSYLQEVIKDYHRYLSDVDNLGLAAPNLLYYRDEIQDMLEEFKGDPRVDFRGAWIQVKALDDILKANQHSVVKQIGHANFKQYQIINDPPRTHWWWWLNRFVPAPPPPAPWWQFWKKPAEEESALEEASSGEHSSDGLGVGEPTV